eukprot:scaffold34586_cov99-Amphora_coffeaeformis.AAC.1
MRPNRELKFSLEKFWKGKQSEDELIASARMVEEAVRKLQKDMDVVTVGEHYLYDMVLSWCENLSLCQKRFEGLAPGLGRMFAIARGVECAEALSMKKWITGNYHYMVREFDTTTKLEANFDGFLADIKRGIDYLGAEKASPVVLGPVSL